LRRLVKAERAGFVASIDTRAIGVAVLELGGGRRRAADSIDFAVGVTDLARCGAFLTHGDGLALIHARDEDSAARAEALLKSAYSLAPDAPAPAPLLVEKLTG